MKRVCGGGAEGGGGEPRDRWRRGEESEEERGLGGAPLSA